MSVDEHMRSLERRALDGDAVALDELKRTWLLEHGIASNSDVDEWRRLADAGCEGDRCGHEVNMMNPATMETTHTTWSCGPCIAAVRLLDLKAALAAQPKDERFALVKRIAAKAPFGWYEGRLIRSRTTTDADAIQWLCDLQNACALDEYGTDERVSEIIGRYPPKF